MKYTFTRKQIVNAFNNKILDDDNFLTYLLSTTSKDIPMNQKSLDKKEAKKLDWEKEFNSRDLGCCGGDNCPHYVCRYDENTGNSVGSNHNEVLKDFIKQTLTQQRTELLEEIEAIVEEQLFWYQGEDYGSITAREALNQVKNLLNKKDETK